MRILGLAAAILLGFAAAGQAARLDSAAVAGDAKWVAHLDVDAMRASSVVQKGYQEFLEKCPVANVAEAIFASSHTLIGMDPRTDLHGLTFYGSQIGKEEGVLIVYADVDQKLLAEKVKKARDYKSSTHGSHELHSWTHEDKRGKRPVTGAFYKDNAVVFSASEAEVIAALDVMDGEKPALTCEVLAAEVPAGTTVLARAVDIAEAPGDSKVAKEIESISIVSGENGGKSFLHVEVITKSSHVAEQMGKVADGIRGLGMLHAIDCPDAKPLIDPIKVKVADKRLTIDSSVPADAVWKHMQSSIKTIIERHHK